jgi:hypothetical protein
LSLLGPTNALDGVAGVGRATELAMGLPPETGDEARVAPILVAAWDASEEAEAMPNA